MGGDLTLTENGARPTKSKSIQAADRIETLGRDMPGKRTKGEGIMCGIRHPSFRILQIIFEENALQKC